MKTLRVKNRSNYEFVKEPVSEIEATFTDTHVTLSFHKFGEDSKSVDIPAQVFMEYCSNVPNFVNSDLESRYSDLEGNILGRVTAGEDVQIFTASGISFQSRAVGDDDENEEDYFLIHSNLGNLEVSEDEYILFLYHSRSIISDLRYSFHNPYHKVQVDGVKMLKHSYER